MLIRRNRVRQKNPCSNLLKIPSFCTSRHGRTAKVGCPFIISDKSLNLQKNPYCNLLKNASFCTTRHCQTVSKPPCSTSFTAARISRTARTEARDVLFDYLHCTRSLDFVDAEHISKYSPVFVEKLLSKVKNRSLSKFLRYHPINEFEPFFESLGLTPSEIPWLLPPNLMFLSDDHVLLDNFHVLCNYGIPRSKIGNVYKQVSEIFRCNNGVLSSKLQAYEELGLSKSTVIKLVICSPSLLVGSVNGDFSRVLGKLKDLGIESDWIRGSLSDAKTYNWGRMLDMMCFIDQMGCSSKDMRNLFKTHPGFLFEESGKKFYVLVAMLLKVGLKVEEVLFLFLHYPRILARNFVKSLWELISFLTEIGMESEDISKIIRTHTKIVGNCSLKKPSTVMSNLNVGPDTLCEIIKDDPLKLISLAARSKSSNVKKESDKARGHLEEKTAFLLSIGYVENSEDMVRALNQFRGRGDQLQERFDSLISAGLDCHVVSNMIRMAPPVLNQSKEVIEMKIEYLVNQLGYPLQSLVGFPSYLCYDIEKIKLRFSMYMWLKKEGAAKPILALSTILACSDARFVKYFVDVHPKGPSVWECLKNSSSLI